MHISRFFIIYIFFLSISLYSEVSAQTLNPQQVKEALTKVFETEGYNKTLVSTTFKQARGGQPNGNFQGMYDAGLLDQVQLDLTTMSVSGQPHDYATVYQPVSNPLVVSWDNNRGLGGRGELTLVAITGSAAFEKITVFPETDYSGRFVAKYKIIELSQFAKFCTTRTISIGDMVEVRAPYAISTDGVEVDWENFKKEGIFSSRSITGIPENSPLANFNVREREKPVNSYEDLQPSKSLTLMEVENTKCKKCLTTISKETDSTVKLIFSGMEFPYDKPLEFTVVNQNLAVATVSIYEYHAYFYGKELTLAHKLVPGTSTLNKILVELENTLMPNRAEFREVHKLIPEAEALAIIESALPEGYKNLRNIAIDYSKEVLKFSYPNAQLGKTGNVKFTFTNGCPTCNETDVKIFLSQAIKGIRNTPRKATLSNDPTPHVAVNVKVASMDYSTAVYPELEIMVEYEILNAKGVKVNVLKKEYDASQIEGKATKEELLVRIANYIDEQLERDIYELIPVETAVVRMGEPDKKGNIEEVYINALPEIFEGHYDVYLCKESDLRVVDGVLNISKISIKGKIKPNDFSTQGVKIRLSGKNEVIQPVLKSGGQIFAIISKNLK